MHAREPFAEIVAKGSIALADLDPWVRDPAAFDRDRNALVRTIVRHRLALFPSEASFASESRPVVAGGDVSPSDLYSVYLREIRRIPLMERSEEFRYVLALEIAKEVLDRELRTPLPTRADLHGVVARVGSKDPTLRRFVETITARIEKSGQGAGRSPSDPRKDFVDRIASRFEEMLAWKRVLVFRTLQLVPGMAQKYRGLGVPLMDLIQEANTSLMKATDCYQWRKGVRFVVYARWWVQQGILKCLSCHSRTVRTPVYLAQKLKKIRDLDERAYVGTGEHLTVEEIGRAMDEPTERIQRALAAARMTVSIDRTLDPSGEFTLRDVLADPHVEEPAEMPEGPALGSRIDELLGVLTDRERAVVELRFGLHEKSPETLEMVSQRFGVSRERIRQIQQQALKKLEFPSRRMNLSAFLARS